MRLLDAVPMVTETYPLTELALNTSPTDVSRWKLNYEYGEFDGNGTLQTSHNNGNFARQTLSFTGATHPFVQTFQYDALNRLLQAKETVNGQQNWLQTFTYDRYGNRTGFTQNVGGQQLTIDSNTLPDVDGATNRFETGQGYEYDYCGNLITDPQNRHFSFNADNKQAEVRDNSNVLIGQYFYDAGGKRVKKIAGTETTIFVYDGMGKLVAEYSTTAPVSSPTTSYVMTDTLQSVRAISDAQGNITSRRDFLPFGEELYAGTANRTTTQGYSAIGADNIRKRFTGYEKDVETGLDFAEARYYNNQHGRFTAVDPLLASGKSANPQTFNRYSYVMNSPLRLTDHTGLQAGEASDDWWPTVEYVRVDTSYARRTPDFRQFANLVKQRAIDGTNNGVSSTLDVFGVSQYQRQEWKRNIVGSYRQTRNVMYQTQIKGTALEYVQYIRRPDAITVSGSLLGNGYSRTWTGNGQMFDCGPNISPTFIYNRQGAFQPIQGVKMGPLASTVVLLGSGASINFSWRAGARPTAAQEEEAFTGSGLSGQMFFPIPGTSNIVGAGPGVSWSPGNRPWINVGVSVPSGLNLSVDRMCTLEETHGWWERGRIFSQP